MMTFFVCLLVTLINQETFGQNRIPVFDFGQNGRIAKIDILRLRISENIQAGRKKWQLLGGKEYTRRTDHFFLKNYGHYRCRTNVVREKFKCFEIKNAQIGYFYDVVRENNRFPGLFRPFNNKSETIEVFEDGKAKQYYIRRGFRQFHGPFEGEALEGLRAARVYLGKRPDLSGVSLTYLSRRWEFTEEEAMVDRENGHYDCAHGHAPGRATEIMRLNSQFARFRIDNDSTKHISVLFGPDGPKMFSKERPESASKWRRIGREIDDPDFYLLNVSSWVILSRKGALEFEVKLNRGCKIGFDCRAGVYLNDRAGFWNSIEISTSFPSTKARKFSKENTPPKGGLPFQLRAAIE